MKQLKLMKTLLVAVGLLLGTSAWAEDLVLQSYDYQLETDASSWTTSDAGTLPLSLQTSGDNKFIRIGTATNGRYAMTNFFANGTDAANTFYSTYTSYTLSFDAIVKGSTRQPSELVVMANGHSNPAAIGKRYLMVNGNNYNEGTNKYLLFLQSTDVTDNGSTDEAIVQKYYINQTDKTVTLPNNAWCTFTLEVTSTTVNYSIVNKSSSVELQSGSYNIPDGQSNLAQGIFTFLHKQGTKTASSGGHGGQVDIDNILITTEVTGDVATVPTLELTGFTGTSRIFTISCNALETIHYTVNGGEVQNGASAGASVNVTVPAGQKLIAWTTKGVATSSNVEITVTGGTPALTAPTVTLSNIGADYNKSYTVSGLTQTITEGAYSYNFQPDNLFYATSSTATSGTNISNNAFTLSEEGTYYVIVSKEGTTSASYQIDNNIPYTLSKTYDFTSESILTASWTGTGNEKWLGVGDNESYKNSTISATSTTELFNDFTVTVAAADRIALIHWHNGKGIQYVNSGGNFSIGLTTVPSGAIIRNEYYQNGSDLVELGTSITIGRWNKTSEKQALTAIKVYTPDPVLLAIADCKAHETNADFATYIDGEKTAGRLLTANDVYAAHTAWQIAQAEAASSNDITKAIFDAAVSDFSRWNNARSNNGQQYTGAPDNKYFDAWDNQVSDARQTIYGLPAGTYTIKVATRSSETLDDVDKNNVWVYDGAATTKVLGNHIGNAGGCLGNGWNWTIIPFTVAEKANVSIGFYSLPGEGTGLWAGADDWHLYKGELTESVTVTDAGFATYASDCALDFSETAIKAYKVKVTKEGDADPVATLTKVNQVPAGTPVLLYKEGGDTNDVPVIANADAVSDNDLVRGTGAAVGTTEDTYTNMILNNVGGNIGFYFANGKKVEKNRAYLHILTTNAPAAAGARMTIVFDEESTGIQKIESEAANKENGAYYNLAGQRVAQPTKGLYIVNGKKVVIK